MGMDSLTRSERWAFVLFFLAAAMAFLAWAFPNMTRLFTIPGGMGCFLAAVYFAWPDLKRLRIWALSVPTRKNIPIILGVVVVLAIGLGCVFFSRPSQPAKPITASTQSSLVAAPVIPQATPPATSSQTASPAAVPTPEHPPIAKFQTFTLRVRPETSCGITEFSEHQAD